VTNYTVDFSGCNTGVTLSDDIATNPPKPSTSTTTPKTSTGTTKTVSSTTVAPLKPDIWTVRYPGGDTMCILLTANITVTYNDSSEVI